MTKNRFYIFIIIGLLISNLILVAFIFLKKPSKHLGPRNLIIERLNFDENQIQQYDGLIKQHRMQIREKEDQLMNLKTQYYSFLRNNEQKKQDSMLLQIGNTTMETEKINFNHFKEIKRICKPDQTKNFDDLIDNFENLFRKPEKPHR